MSAFDHYMYVLSCWDGSLYTGYATDVRARLAAHRAGRGAKYTKAHAPVELVAQAWFYSKQRAMSAEALFKQLPRERKDRLLRLAQDEPLETVLRREFGIGVLMRLYLDELFEPQLLEAVAHAGLGGDRAGDSPEPASDAYYVDMMRAWYFAEALVKQEQSAMPYFEHGGGVAPLDEWTRRKAIQKALESRRIPSEMKERLRELR